MTEQVLQGQRVTFTGRLASLTRREAEELVRNYGGTLVSSVNRQTSLLIVGQEDWPLLKDGRLTHKLQRAQALQQAGGEIKILHERDWLAQLGLESVDADVHTLYTTARLAQLLKIPSARLRSWMKAGLIHPARTDQGICYFDYGQVSDARTLLRLTEGGVKPERIRQSLRQLEKWLGSVERPLAQLAALEQSGELLVRWQDHLVEPTGQRRLNFSDPAPEPSMTMVQRPRNAEEWYELGCEQEDAGRLAEAAHAYRQALLLGGADKNITFNLANVLHRLGHRGQALERLYQVLELDGQFVEAWNNLGVLLHEVGRLQEAVRAWEQALKLEPQYMDAHYNLADLLEETGRPREARPHWQTYIRHDPQSDWGKRARTCLARSS